MSYIHTLCVIILFIYIIIFFVKNACEKMQEEICEQVVRLSTQVWTRRLIFKALVSRKTVYNIKNHLLSEGNAKRKPRTNDKCPVAKKSFVAKVKDRTKRNSLKTMRVMTREMNECRKRPSGGLSMTALELNLEPENENFFLLNILKQKSKLLWILKKKTQVIVF